MWYFFVQKHGNQFSKQRNEVSHKSLGQAFGSVLLLRKSRLRRPHFFAALKGLRVWAEPKVFYASRVFLEVWNFGRKAGSKAQLCGQPFCDRKRFPKKLKISKIDFRGTEVLQIKKVFKYSGILKDYVV